MPPRSNLKDAGFLSDAISVTDLVLLKGDIHHIFPKNYLKKNGVPRGQYNQIANYAYMQSDINVAIRDNPTKDYFKTVLNQCNGSQLRYGNINNIDDLKSNFRMHCIPEGIENMEIEDYQTFLEERRKLMAHKIKDYYDSL